MTDLIADLAEVVAQDEAGATDRELGSLTLAIYRVHAAEIEADKRDAERHAALYEILMRGDLIVGEARLSLRVTGVPPSREDVDLAIDAAMPSAREDGNG